MDVTMQEDFYVANHSPNEGIGSYQIFNKQKFYNELAHIESQIEVIKKKAKQPIEFNIGRASVSTAEDFIRNFNFRTTSQEDYHRIFENINNDMNHKLSKNYNDIYTELDNLNNLLINGPSKAWHLLQQQLSISNHFYDPYLSNLLDTINQVFCLFIKAVDQVIICLFNIKKECLQNLQIDRSQYNESIFQQKATCVDFYVEKLNELLKITYSNALVVVKQPPQIVLLVKMEGNKKAGLEEDVGEDQPKSKFAFDTEIRILGIEIDNSMHNQVQDNIKILAKDAWNVVLYSNEEKTNFESSKNTDHFYYNKFMGIISFKSITIYRYNRQKDEHRRSNIKDLRYAIKYNIPLYRLIGRPPFDQKFAKLSLPFSIKADGKPDLEIESRMFVERAFMDMVSQDRKSPIEVMLLQIVSWDQIKWALQLKFEAIVEETLKNVNKNYNRNMWRKLQEMDFSYLKHRLLNSTHSDIAECLSRVSPKNIKWQCCCYQCKYGKVGVNAASETEIQLGTLLEHVVAIRTTPKGYRACTFLSWFFTICEMIGVLGELWNNEQIGFCDRMTAEDVLMSCSDPSIVLRFADTDQGRIRLAIRELNASRPIHHIAYYKPTSEGFNTNPEDTFSTCEELKTIVFNYADLINAFNGDKIKDHETSKIIVTMTVNTKPRPIIIQRYIDDPEWYANKRGIKDAKINNVLAKLPWRTGMVVL